MKKIFYTTLLLFCAATAFAAPRIRAKANGFWSHSTTWNLNRLPQGGDTIEIPKNFTVRLTADQSYNAGVYLIVAGKLNIENNSTSLRLTSNSTILVVDGQIVGGGSASQKIRIGNNTVFDGNDPAVTGYRMANGTSNGFAGIGNSPLPVHFVAFSAAKKGADVLVQWATSTEESARSFEVERSVDGNNWVKLSSIAAVGNSNTIQQYAYTDKAVAAPVLYYRIRQVDVNGTFIYTEVKQVRGEVAGGVQVLGGAGRIVLQLAQSVGAKNLQVRIVNFSGQLVSEQALSTAGSGTVVLHTPLRGRYVVMVSNGTGLNASAQVAL